MPINRLGVSFSAKPNVTIDGERHDVSDTNKLTNFKIGDKTYRGIKINETTFLAVTQKENKFRGNKYQLDLMSTAKTEHALDKWKVKVGSGTINKLGYMGDTFTAKKPESFSGSFILNGTFADEFRHKALSQACQELRHANLKIKDEELFHLRWQGKYTPAHHTYLTNTQIPKEERQKYLDFDLLGKPADNELILDSGKGYAANMDDDDVDDYEMEPNKKANGPKKARKSGSYLDSHNNKYKKRDLRSKSMGGADNDGHHMPPARMRKKSMDGNEVEMMPLNDGNGSKKYRDRAHTVPLKPPANYPAGMDNDDIHRVNDPLINIFDDDDDAELIITTANRQIDEDDDDNGVDSVRNHNVNSGDDNDDADGVPNLSLPKAKVRGFSQRDDKRVASHSNSPNLEIQQNASSKPKQLSVRQKLARNFVSIKLNSLDFMGKVEERSGHLFQLNEVQLLERKIYDRIDNEDLGKTKREVMDTAGRIMMDEINQHITGTRKESLQSLNSLPDPIHAIQSNDDDDDILDFLEDDNDDDETLIQNKQDDILAFLEDDDGINDEMSEVNGPSYDDPLKAQQLKKYNRNQADRYLSKSGVINGLVKQAREKGTDGTLLENGRKLSSGEERQLKAAITKAFEDCPKAIISSLQNPIALEATLTFIQKDD